MSSLRAAFEDLLARRSLDAVTAERAFGEILDGEAAEALIAGFLIALKLKGESAAELKGAARAMRASYADPTGCAVVISAAWTIRRRSLYTSRDGSAWQRPR